MRVQVLTEQSLRHEQLAEQGQLPLLPEAEKAAVPETVAVRKPAVNLRAKTTRAAAQKPKSGSSAVELLASSRGLDVLETAPVETDIWVQIGAFHSKTNASNVLGKVSGIGGGQISQVDVDGQVLHRVRLGPATSVEMADDLLDGVFGLGFTGARIVVD